MSIVFILVLFTFYYLLLLLDLIFIVCFCYGALKAVVVPELECSIKTRRYDFLVVSYYFLLFRMVTYLDQVVTENGGGNNIFAVTPPWKGGNNLAFGSTNLAHKSKKVPHKRKNPREQCYSRGFFWVPTAILPLWHRLWSVECQVAGDAPTDISDWRRVCVPVRSRSWSPDVPEQNVGSNPQGISLPWH